MVSGPIRGPARDEDLRANPWRPLWAMMVGFFMILVDATIVAVANPVIKDKLNADYDAVIWVTSAYLLAYTVPLLVAGRLGDRFGPKNLYLVGLAVFTASSLWCGLAGSIQMLITARVVQGVGAALLTPQTLSMITRIFPAERRGVAMSVWGATAGVATLLGPLAGGVLVDALGWQWIFFVNVPIGLIGLGLAVWLIPTLSIQRHRFDLLGVLLSGIGMFLIVFALQEGQSHHWASWIWGTMTGGIAFVAAFVFWQVANKNEPLIPPRIFSDRNFGLSNLGIAVMGFVAVALMLPLMFYLQAVCGLSPTRAALVGAPTAIAALVLAPFVGRIVDRTHPRPVIGAGFAVLAIALTWLSIEMTPTTPIWRLALPQMLMGIGMAFIWAPLAATATRNLPPDLAGAGSGVYNAIRQVGSVLGSASMAALMTWRLSAEVPPMPDGGTSMSQGSVTQLPDFLHVPFAGAMSQSVLLPAFVALFGVIAALYMLAARNSRGDRQPHQTGEEAAVGVDDGEGYTEKLSMLREPEEYIFDDDDYVEYTVSAEEVRLDDEVTEPMSAGVASAGTLSPHQGDDDPFESWHFDPVSPGPEEPVESWPEEGGESWPEEGWESWRDERVEPIGFAHNGFHADREPLFRDLHQVARRSDPGNSTGAGAGAHHRTQAKPRHYRDDPDPDSYGRHAVRD